MTVENPGAASGLLLLGAEWFGEEPGGLNRYLRDLLAGLQRAGGPARAVLLGPAGDLPAGVEAAGRRDALLPARLRDYVRAAARAAGDAGVVDAHFALYAFAPVVLGPLRRKPLVVHFQGPWAEEGLMQGDGRWHARSKHWVERAVYRRARELVVLSGAFKRILVERYGISPWRVHVVAPGVDLERFSPGLRAEARARLGMPEGAWVAFTARRLVPRMGIDVLLEAWAGLAGRTGRDDLRLFVAGDGPLRRELEQRVEALGISGSVRLLGRVDDEELADHYRAADVSVVPSVALEGYGLVVLEALACGTPVVGTDVGGLAEAVGGLDPGLVVPAGDAGALSDRLAGALDGSAPLPGAGACRRHAEGFSWDRVVERHLDVYGRAARPQAPEALRVVYLDHTARLSGGELALLRLLPALRGVDAHVVLAEEGPLVARLLRRGISVEVLPMAEAARGLPRDRVRPGALPATSVLRSAAYVVRLAWRLRRLRPDLVHANSLKSALCGGLAARIAGVPVVWHVRDRIAGDYLPPAAVRLVRGAARWLPAGIVANSATTLATLGNVRRSVVVPSPVAGAPVPTGSNGGPLTVGAVGRLAPWKGQHVFLEAFARAFPDGDERAVVVGAPLFGEEAYERELRDLAGRMGLDGRVEFRGFREDVPAELARLDVLVHCSVVPEPFGQVVLEGMAAGLPVVAAGAGGPAEFVEDGVNGLLYPPGDAPALAALLGRLAGDPGLRRRLADAGSVVAAAFSPEAAATRLEAFYAGLTGNGSE